MPYRFAFAAAAVLFLAACNIAGKQLSVAEYNSHMQVKFEKLHPRYKPGGGDVRVIGKSTERERRLVKGAVARLNKALPSCAQMTLKPPIENLRLKDYVGSDGNFDRDIPRQKGIPNTIHIEFLSRGYRGGHEQDKSAATAFMGGYIQIKRNDASWSKHSDSRKLEGMIVHELIHSMGLWGHVPT
ncbi:MAG: hypothetical protein OXG99_17845, partial [Alphaproteobacteria bacterium]|nr:hypothetical protein [Alphaproteobacteria bacterium]